MQVHEKKLEIYFSKISAVLNVIPLVFLFLWQVSFLKFLMFFFFTCFVEGIPFFSQVTFEATRGDDEKGDTAIDDISFTYSACAGKKYTIITSKYFSNQIMSDTGIFTLVYEHFFKLLKSLISCTSETGLNNLLILGWCLNLHLSE